MRVIKRSGEAEEFDPEKAIYALLKVGATRSEAECILQRVMPELYDGITTEELYRRIRAQLPTGKAQQFSLKKALMLMGPDGHSFETFMARVFREMGYHTDVRLTLNGRCVTHEVDVVITKGDYRASVECKFHNALGIKSGIQEALYSWGRYLDIRDVNDLDSVWLVTNTKFSSDVVKYANCVGMNLIGWRYPDDGSLEQLISRNNIYPITVLNIKRGEQRTLLNHDFVVCRDILDRKPEMLTLLPREIGERIIKSTEEFMDQVMR
ncbi:MAG: restriction endonuclease [Methanomassiliicoccales archaeon]|nr:restriction endonuclease [Methanomassiliicoccales archaeon]